jgi:hypothetical protein
MDNLRPVQPVVESFSRFGHDGVSRCTWQRGRSDFNYEPVYSFREVVISESGVLFYLTLSSRRHAQVGGSLVFSALPISTVIGCPDSSSALKRAE